MREYKITATVKHMDWDEPVTYIYKMNIEADTPNEARKYARDITAKDRNEAQEKINNLLHWLDTRECLRWSYYKWFNDEREV